MTWLRRRHCLSKQLISSLAAARLCPLPMRKWRWILCMKNLRGWTLDRLIDSIHIALPELYGVASRRIGWRTCQLAARLAVLPIRWVREGTKSLNLLHVAAPSNRSRTNWGSANRQLTIISGPSKRSTESTLSPSLQMFTHCARVRRSRPTAEILLVENLQFPLEAIRRQSIAWTDTSPQLHFKMLSLTEWKRLG
jgi:hypothetical protein